MLEIEDSEDYARIYTEESFWDKARKFAKKAGYGLISRAMTLYYTSRDPDTPKWAKSVIYTALGYFILPIDWIPDIAPVAGYTDDLAVILSAFAVISAHIKEEHKELAKQKLQAWFK